MMKRPIVCVVPAEKSKAQNCHCGVAERSRPMKLKFIWTSWSEMPWKELQCSAMNLAW